MDYESTRRVLAALEREGVRYVVFGAAALNLHGLARSTEDLDIFVEPESENIALLRKALGSVYDDPDIEEISTEDLLNDYPAVQYNPPDGGLQLDILTRLGEAWAYDDLVSERVDFEGLEVSVVTPRTLYEMKKDTVRPKDWGDAERLREFFDLED